VATRDDNGEALRGSRVDLRAWLADIRYGVPIDGGHHVADEAPDDLAEGIRLSSQTL
jgi:hypothetical protein